MKGDERKGKKQGRAASGIARSGDGCLLLFGFVAAAAAAAIFVVVVLPLALLTNSRSRFRWLFSFVSRPFLLPSHFFALLYALLPPSAFLGGAHQHTPALTRQFKCRRGGDFSTYCGGIGCTFPPPTCVVSVLVVLSVLTAEGDESSLHCHYVHSCSLPLPPLSVYSFDSAGCSQSFVLSFPLSHCSFCSYTKKISTLALLGNNTDTYSDTHTIRD